jgi:hypothetical protein
MTISVLIGMMQARRLTRMRKGTSVWRPGRCRNRVCNAGARSERTFSRASAQATRTRRREVNSFAHEAPESVSDCFIEPTPVVWR